MYGSLSFASFSLFRSSHLTFFLFNFPLEGRTRSSSGANALPFSSSPRVYPHASSPLLSLSLSLSSQFSYSIYCFR